LDFNDDAENVAPYPSFVFGSFSLSGETPGLAGHAGMDNPNQARKRSAVKG